MSTPKKLRASVRKSAAIGLVAVLGAGMFAPSATAAESYDVDLNSAGYGQVEEDGRATSERWIATEHIRATTDELQSIGGAAKGQLTGTVSLTADAERLQAARDAGIHFDLAATASKTNKTLDGTRIETSPELQTVVTFDQAKIREAAVSLGIDPDMAQGEIVLVRSDHKVFAANIAPASMWDGAGIKAGQTIPGFPESLASSNETPENGVWNGPALFPIVGVTKNGPERDGEFPYALSTIVDPYSDGDAAVRQVQIASQNTRAMPSDLANCLTASCGFWAVAVIAEVEDGAVNKRVAVTDEFRVNVSTTVSAGKTPTGELKLASGDSVSFLPQATANAAFGDYFNAALGAWDLLPEFLDSLTASQQSVAVLDGISATADGLSVSTQTNRDVSASYRTDAGKHLLTLTSTDEIAEWSYGSEQIAVGDRLLFNSTALGANVVQLEGTVTTLTPTVLELELSVSYSDEEWNLPASTTPDYVAVPVSVGMDLIGGEALFQRTPGFTVRVAPAALPTPEARPDVKEGPMGQPVVIDVLANDIVNEGYEIGGQVLLINPSTGGVTWKHVIAGQGTYTLSEDGMSVVFTPEAGFSGTADSIGYTWTQRDGFNTMTASSTAQAVITPATPAPLPTPEPEARPDVATAEFGQPVTMDVIKNDRFSEGFSMVPQSLRLVNPSDDELVSTVDVEAQGTYEVAGEELVRFTPEADFHGDAEVLTYTWQETDGVTTQSASATVQAKILPPEVVPVVTPEPEPTPEVVPVPEPQEEVIDEPTVEPQEEVIDEQPPVDEPVEQIVSAGFSGKNILMAAAGALALALAAAGALLIPRLRKKQ